MMKKRNIMENVEKMKMWMEVDLRKKGKKKEINLV